MLATVHSGASGYAQKAAAAHGEPLMERVYPELLQPWEQPISKGKTVGSKEKQRAAVMNWLQTPISPPPCTASEEWKAG